jgi:chloramphenicol-sensitive protein RarD
VGRLPVYFSLLDAVSPIEILAHRIVWSFVLLALFLLATRTWSQVTPLLQSKRTLELLAVAAVFLSVNWGTYVYAVSTDQIVEGSLRILDQSLGQRGPGGTGPQGAAATDLQWVALGIAVLGVLELTWRYGADPGGSAWSWPSSFGTYGLREEVVGAKAVPAMAVETSVLLPIALRLLAPRRSQRPGGLRRRWTGPVRAAQSWPRAGHRHALARLRWGSDPRSAIGSWTHAVPDADDHLPDRRLRLPGGRGASARWAGFAVIWLALAIFAVDAWRSTRGRRQDQAWMAVAEPD